VHLSTTIDGRPKEAELVDRAFRGLWITSASTTGIPIHRLQVAHGYLELQRPLRESLVITLDPKRFVDARSWVFPYRHFFSVVEGDQLLYPGAFVPNRPRALRRCLERTGWRVVDGGHRFRHGPAINDLPP
jgi:hypothetical protein